MAEEFSNDAAKLVSNLSPEQRADVLGQAKGGKATSGEVKRILTQLNIDPNQVFSAQNINQTATNPAANSIDLNDLNGVYGRLQNELGFGQAQEDYQTAVQALRDYDAESRERQVGLDQRLTRTSVLRGEQALDASQRSLGRESLAISAQAFGDRLTAIQSELGRRFGIAESQRNELAQLMVSNPGAGVTFTDTIESAAQKINQYNVDLEKKTRKEAEKDAKKKYKDELKAQLISLGLSTKNSKGGSLSTKAMEQKLGGYNSEIAYLEKQKFQLELDNIRSQISNRNKKDDKSIEIDYSNKGLKDLIDQGVNMGDRWTDIAAVLSASGFGVQSGSAADLYLRHKFLGEENPFDN